MRKSPFAAVAVAAVLAFGASAAGTSVAQASTGSTAYVSPSGSSSGADTSCATAGYASISKAVNAVSAGSTVVVCRGVYQAQVVVSKPLTLAGQPGAVIDAQGQKPLRSVPQSCRAASGSASWAPRMCGSAGSRSGTPASTPSWSR